MEWYVAYLALGAIAGFLGGMFGVGGGLLLVPVLWMLFDAQNFTAAHTMHLALGTSMSTIIFTSLSSLRKHHQLGAVNWQVVRRVTPGILFGTLIGALTASLIPARGLSIFFALFVFFAAAQILLNKRPQATRQLPGMASISLFGTITGWLSSLVSIGGGTLVVPFLIWCNVPIRNAIGTASAIGFPIAVGGTIGYILTGLQVSDLPSPSLGYVFLPATLGCAIISILTAPIGAKIAHRTNVAVLHKLFALLLIGLAAKLLWKVFG